MAQRPKASVRDAFLRVARQLFAEHGYAGTSLRAVAAAANGSLGNLRNYFPSKDELFAAACEPVLGDLQTAMRAFDTAPLPRDRAELIRLDRAAVEAVAGYIVEHRQPLALLLSKSEGSQLAAWRDQLFDAYVDLELRRLDEFIAQHPNWLRRPPSPAMVRALCRMYFDLAAGFVRRCFGVDEFWRTLREFDAFRQAGFTVYFEDSP